MAIWEGSGTVAGATTATATALMRFGAGGTGAGSTAATAGTVMDLAGTGFLSGYTAVYGMPVVVDVPWPLDVKSTCTRVFDYMDPFVRGDLSIFFSLSSLPAGPVYVAYTIFQVRPDHSLFQAGPSRRTPVMGAVGEYYVSGMAGELGQPGRWLIRWEYRWQHCDETKVLDTCFFVKDAVMTKHPLDVTVRVKKYGWWS